MSNESELIFIEATRLEQFTVHFYLLCRRKSTVSVHESFCIVSGSIESVHFYARRVAIKIVSFLFLNPAGYWPTEAFTYETSCFASHRIKIKCSNEPYFRSYSHLRVCWSLLNAKLREIYQARREGVVSRKKLSFYITLLNITLASNTIIYLYISLIAHYSYLFTCIPNIRSYRTSLKTRQRISLILDIQATLAVLFNFLLIIFDSIYTVLKVEKYRNKILVDTHDFWFQSHVKDLVTL